MPDIHLGNALQALRNEDWDNAEAEAGAAYSEILEHQAAHHFDKKDTILTMKYASDLCHRFPESPSGYYWEGRVWEEKLYFARAFDSYQKGLHLDPLDSRSNERISIAETNSLRKVDFIARLPAELLLLLFDMIPETRFTCIHISTVWRQILLSLPQLWKQLNVAFKKEFIMANGHLRRDIEKRFRTFLMPSLESFQMTTDVDFSIPLSWVTRSECKGIKKIVVFDYNDYELMPQISMQKTLPYFATSLAHLAITSASSPRGSYMRFLLSVLPKLQSLQYRVRRLLFGDPSPAMQNHFSGRIVPQGSDLRLLAWPVVSDGSGQRIAEYLAAYCPKLRDIAIADFDEDELDSKTFVDTVLRDCHELRCFSTGPYRLVRNSDMEEQNGGGLKFILFHHKIPFPQKTIASIFEEQQQNLEEFYYAAGSIVAFPLRMVESSICLQRLHTLCIDSYGQLKYQPSAPLTYILRGCPVLQNICFSHVKVGRDISSAIVAVPQLTMLTLYECKFKSCDALCHLVGMLASKNTLKGLTLAPDPLRSGSHLYLLIPLLFSVGSLRYLRLVGFNSMIRDGSIEYVEDSRRCQRLWPRPKPGGVTFHAVIIRCSG